MAIARGLCSVADVSKWTRPGAVYSTTTNPTLVQVESFIDDAIDQIYAEIDGYGIIVPITDVTTTRLVKQINTILASMFVIMTLHQTVEPNATPYTKYLLDEYTRQMDLIRSKAILPDDAKDGDRPTIPAAQAVWSKLAEIWDADTEDTTLRGHYFTMDKEF